jgi:hypothetical protein
MIWRIVKIAITPVLKPTKMPNINETTPFAPSIPP